MKVLKVLYDSHIFCTQNYGGISKYYLEIFNNASFDYSVPYEKHFLLNKTFLDIHGLNESCLNRIPKMHGLLYKLGIIAELNQYKISREVKRSNPTIYHATSKMYQVPESVKKVVTIHDFIFEECSDMYQTKALKRIVDIMTQEKEKQLFNSDKIIAISQNTKQDILKYYPSISADKIDVIYHGGIDNLECESMNLPENFILFVGTRSTYKNFKILVEAFEEICKKNNDITLVCVGGGMFNEKEIDELKQRNIYKRVYQYLHVNNKKLNFIYQKAKMFVFPSLYEGFGIPILESFASKCPTIVSNASCFPEIAQDAALYFDPFDKDSLVDKITIVLHDIDVRNKYINLGEKRSQDFSWKKTMTKHLDVYNSMI